MQINTPHIVSSAFRFDDAVHKTYDTRLVQSIIMFREFDFRRVNWSLFPYILEILIIKSLYYVISLL